MLLTTIKLYAVMFLRYQGECVCHLAYKAFLSLSRVQSMKGE